MNSVEESVYSADSSSKISEEESVDQIESIGTHGEEIITDIQNKEPSAGIPFDASQGSILDKSIITLSSGSQSSTDSNAIIDPRNPDARGSEPSQNNPPAKSSRVSKNDRARSSCEVSDATFESTMMSPRQSPPLQVMDRSAPYEPGRISSSVFTANSTPQEWSLASNESSLFSLHIGHIGTKNGASDMGDQYRRSSDLALTDEMMSNRTSMAAGQEPARGTVDTEGERSTPILSDKSSHDIIIQKIHELADAKARIPETSWDPRKNIGKIQPMPTSANKKPEKPSSCCKKWICCLCSSASLSCCCSASGTCCSRPKCSCGKMPSCSCCNCSLGWCCNWNCCSGKSSCSNWSCSCLAGSCCPSCSQCSKAICCWNWSCWKLFYCWNWTCCSKGPCCGSWSCCSKGLCCRSWSCCSKGSCCKSWSCCSKRSCCASWSCCSKGSCCASWNCCSKGSSCSSWNCCSKKSCCTSWNCCSKGSCCKSWSCCSKGACCGSWNCCSKGTCCPSWSCCSKETCCGSWICCSMGSCCKSWNCCPRGSCCKSWNCCTSRSCCPTGNCFKGICSWKCGSCFKGWNCFSTDGCCCKSFKIKLSCFSSSTKPHDGRVGMEMAHHHHKTKTLGRTGICGWCS